MAAKHAMAGFWGAVGALAGCVLGIAGALVTGLHAMPVWGFLAGTFSGIISGYAGGTRQEKRQDQVRDIVGEAHGAPAIQ